MDLALDVDKPCDCFRSNPAQGVTFFVLTFGVALIWFSVPSVTFQLNLWNDV